MIKNPIQLRLAKLAEWQLKTFMATLCERMYPNYVFFCKESGFAEPAKFKQLLDLIWEPLLVSNAKINFESQLEKFEPIIPQVDQYDCYSVYPAVDACQALGEALHAYLSTDTLEHAIKVSDISLSTVATLEMTQADRMMDEEELRGLQSVVEELDIQWEIYRLLREQEEPNLELIKGLRQDIRESKTSNIGVFLSD